MGFTIGVGSKAPEFRLSGVDGAEHSLGEHAGKSATVVAFTCNHCPAAIGAQDRIIALQRELGPRGVQIIAINSNEEIGHPTDSFAHMVERAREKGFNFPYLRDKSQDVAKAYGAQRTPHFFLLDAERRVVYTGRMDDNPYEEGKQKTSELRNALEQVLAGQKVTVAPTDPIGCNVKWEGKDAHWMPASLADFDAS
jgi:peroxiredoxin